MKRSILTIAVASCLTTQVMADTDIPTLPTVEIQTTQADRAETVTVITRDDTEGEHFTNINDSLFSGTPGVSTSRRSETGFGGPNSGFLIRGLNGARVPVFVDGIPIQMNNHFHARVDRYSSDMADSMEITRGPSVLKHGASAVGGVVDIYTRTPGAGTSGFIQVTKGTYNSTEVFGDIGVGDADSSLLFSFSDRLTDGPVVINQDDWHTTPIDEPLFAAEAHDLTNLNLKFTKTINNELSFGLRASNAVETPEEMPFARDEIYARYAQDETDLVLHLDRKTADSNTLIAIHDNTLDNFSACYKNGSFDVTKQSSKGSCSTPDADSVTGVIPDATKSARLETETGVLIKHTVQRGGGNSTTFGLHKVKYTDDRFDSSVKKSKGSHISGYVQVSEALDDATRISGGVRITSGDDFKTNISPEINMIKKLDASRTLRLRAGKAFRVPRIGETDEEFNSTIKPEDFNHAEIGLNQVFADGGEFDVTAWVMKGDNLIESTGGFGTNTTYANSGSFSNKGIEASLSRPITANLSAYAAATLSSLGTESSAPQTMFDLGLEYRKDLIRVNLDLRDASRNSDPVLIDEDYTVLDGRAQYDLTKDTTVFVDVDNITDTRYVTYQRKGTKAVNVGRMVSIGLRHSF